MFDKVSLPLEEFQSLLKELQRIADSLERAYPPLQNGKSVPVTERDLGVLDEEELWKLEIEEEQKRLSGLSEKG